MSAAKLSKELSHLELGASAISPGLLGWARHEGQEPDRYNMCAKSVAHGNKHSSLAAFFLDLISFSFTFTVCHLIG